MYTYFVAPLKTILSHSLIFSFVSRKKETERVTTRSMFSRYVSSSLSRIVEMPDKIIVDIFTVAAQSDAFKNHRL